MNVAVRVAVWLPFDWIQFSNTPSLTTWYKGDGTPAQRGGTNGFNPDSPNFRLAQQVNITINDTTGKMTAAYPYKNTGISYKKTLEKNLVPPRETITSRQASDSGMVYKEVSNTGKDASGNPGKFVFKLTGAVSEPFQWYAPDIDYDFKITVYSTGLVQVEGAHDGFPCYEVYKKVNGSPWATVYNWDGPAQGKDLLALFPPMDVTVNHAG
ncbi:DUF3238 domain-containing protein [Paenibacillus sp. GCM10012307]|uniref:DUF3238 domain-containing protein n=1 Tax=Paenibacillus roseus TaxID=2798579 RepID=A0A934MQ13_9BACL|nr:DUF3238 domain-containing protein [Paenibacillus roseus]MBJ6360939.1 DUF3238 domain-containing protein [Paenibacillus roseus]